MDEKEIRMHEVANLEKHCDSHGIGVGNTEHPVRMFIRRRIEEIEREFGIKKEEPAAPEQDESLPQETPAQEGAAGEPEAPVQTN